MRFTRADSGGTAHYTWDLGTRVPQILDDGSGQYVYGQGLVSHIVGGSTLYELPDALGTTNTVVDSNGTVVLSQTYDEYGNLVSRTGSAYEEFQFAGQQTDPDGLQYLRARYYDPNTGRFLSRDSWSVSDKTVFHPYAYSGNNPTTLKDPSGHAGCQDLTGDGNDADCLGNYNGQGQETASGSGPSQAQLQQIQAQRLAAQQQYSQQLVGNPLVTEENEAIFWSGQTDGIGGEANA